VYASCLLDGLFLSALTLVTGGYQSFLYWFFVPLILRSCYSVPRASSQLLLNITLCFCYVVAGLMEFTIARHLLYYETFWEIELETGGLTDRVEWETLVLRTFVLGLMTVCSFGVQVLLERQRLALEEAREFAVREGQLRSAGRMAAEFVHSIKNPLAIINTTAYSLQRTLRNGQPDAREKVRIIQEEVERSDRIITQVMGYAQLSEGRVEKLDVVEELDNAIERVLPPAANYPVVVHRDYTAGLSPLLMQRRHLSETFINILQNAREALGERGGNIYVAARRHGFDSVAVVLRDDGPGIPRGKHEQIFEAYYTTRDKGTGLGLSQVKHNVELYGGKIIVESELGKGASFTLLFPARALLDVNLQV
jgi:signal transduction histidine kinase